PVAFLIADRSEPPMASFFSRYWEAFGRDCRTKSPFLTSSTLGVTWARSGAAKSAASTNASDKGLPRMTKILGRLAQPALKESYQTDDQIRESHREPPGHRQTSEEGSGRGHQVRSPQAREIRERGGEPQQHDPHPGPRGERQPEGDERQRRRRQRVRGDVDVGVLHQQVAADRVLRPVEAREVDRLL